MEIFFVLLVPFSVIVGILLTRNVFVSLFLGLLCGGVIVNLSALSNLPFYLFNQFYSSFFVLHEGQRSLVWNKLHIIGFLLCLGILGEFFLRSGGVRVLSTWVRQKIKSAKQSEFVIFILGIIIFIDGCFNAVILGQIAKTLGEVYRVSKERLAYIVDSTSSPVCVLVPISSWGAYILGILQVNLPKEQNAFVVLIESVGFNFYAWLTLICVGVVIVYQVNAPMQKYLNHSPKECLNQEADSIITSPWVVFTPFALLFFSVFVFVVLDGYQKVGAIDMMQIFALSDINRSLFLGGLVGIFSSFLLICRFVDVSQVWQMVLKGVSSMIPAIGVLILAWSLAPMLRDDLQIGMLLSEALGRYEFNSAFLPLVLFGVSMVISFSTGTSWGCFAIMLPIGIGLAVHSGGDVSLAVASVLGGSLYGDHTSPISDTTILSSASTRCPLHNHFITQMFFAGICAFCSFVGLFVYTQSESLGASFGMAVCILLMCLWGVRGLKREG